MLSTGAVESGARAFRMAGLGPRTSTPQDYDCFTYMVLTQLEDYGFCKKGEAANLRVPALCGLMARSPPTRPAVSFGKRMSKACYRSWKARVSYRASMVQTGRFPTPRWALNTAVMAANQVCHSTLILGRA